MYGRANPKPEPPSYDAEDMRKMRAAEEKDLLRARAAEASAAARGSGAFASSLADASAAWAEIDVPCGLGDAASDTVKWRQNQTFVEVFVALPDPARGAADVKVRIGAERLSVAVAGVPVLDGRLFAPVKAEASTWVVADGVLELSLLKRFRRGNYENGKTNAATFWFSILEAGNERRKPRRGRTAAAPRGGRAGWRSPHRRRRTTTPSTCATRRERAAGELEGQEGRRRRGETLDADATMTRETYERHDRCRAAHDVFVWSFASTI